MKKRSDILGIVLAGGKSTRFGRDKTFLAEDVIKVLSKIFNKVIIVGCPRPVLGQDVRGPASDIVEDIIPDKGPLGGIYTALVQSDLPYIFVTACDMPFLKAEVVEEIVDKIDGFHIVVPRGNPLCGVYSKKCIPVIKDVMDKGELKVQGIFDRLNTRILDIKEEIININTQEEYERWFRQDDRLSKDISY